ncbi:MAG: TetR/AcrR family transcriptional regulator [Deltaproteobacteria bacterium]|nr:TetR/AcrR family transcriptional regulator [Deltaproteobacteria bacterium]
MKPPRSPEALEKIRARVLEAALALIADDGFPALTMRALAKRLSMSAPNLYNFFASKDEIYLHLVIQGFTLLKERLETALGSSGDPLSQGRAAAFAYVGFGIENPVYYEIMFTGRTPKHDDYLGTPLEGLAARELEISMQVAELAAGAARNLAASAGMEGPINNAKARTAVIQAWSLLHGMVSLHNSRVISYVDPDAKSTFADIITELSSNFFKDLK